MSTPNPLCPSSPNKLCATVSVLHSLFFSTWPGNISLFLFNYSKMIRDGIFLLTILEFSTRVTLDSKALIVAQYCNIICYTLYNL